MIQKLYLNAGQMKAGTTFLYSLLRNHPNIYFTPEKEIHFLSEHFGSFKILSDKFRIKNAQSLLRLGKLDFVTAKQLSNRLQWITRYLDAPNDMTWYEGVFKEIKPAQYAGDFSNLTCTIPPEGLEKIATIMPSTKLTYCVRDPVSRAFSHMKFHLKFTGNEQKINNLDMEKIVKMLVSRNILPQSQTLEHIDNLVGAFGEEKVRIIHCESMWEDPQSTVDALCEFLEISKFGLKNKLHRPVNVGPKEEISGRVSDIISRSLEREIEQTAECLVKYSSLVINH